LESEAVLAILERVEAGRWTLVSSAALEFELRRMPDPQRRARTLGLLSIAREYAGVGASEGALAGNLLSACGFYALDALHIACAESVQVDVFLTTDDRLLSAALRAPSGMLKMRVVNPLVWLTDILARE
jgi:hypothetical protein